MGCGSSIPDDQMARGPEDEELAYEYGGRRVDKSGNEVDKYGQKDNKPEEDGLFFEAEKVEDGEQFMATKPWIGALVAPSNAPQVDQTEPSQNLALEYVNGYRCEDSRQNLFWTNQSNKIVYMTAALGIVLDTQTNKQEFFGGGNAKTAKGHNDDITALAVNSNRTLCATGQLGKDPMIFVWDIATKEIKWSAKQGRGTRTVKTIRFTPDDQYIFTTDEHNDHNVHVFKASTGQKFASANTGGDPILDMDTSNGSYRCAIAGKRGLKFFELSMTINPKRCLFSGNPMKDMASVNFIDNSNCISGSVDGDIYFWSGNSCQSFIKAHQGAIHALSVRGDLVLSSGSNDKKLKVWSVQNLKSNTPTQTIDLPHYARSLDVKDGNILVGTRDGQILTIQDGNTKQIMNGHMTGETWGLAICPKTGLVITTGDDNKILVFDPKQNKTINQGTINKVAGVKKKIGGASTLSMFPPNQCSRGVAINSNSGHVAIGCNEGTLSVRQSINDLDTEIAQNKDSKEWIEVLKYSPDQKILGVGSHDNNIRFYDATNYNLISVASKHNSFITSFDFSKDGQYISSNCGAYELLFFNVQTGQQNTSGATALRDEPWNTYTNKLGWAVQGIFPPYTDGSHVNGVDRSASGKIFATGDDWGWVNLYRNPNSKGSIPKSFRAHSSHVVRVMFNSDDSYLYSVGGYDRCLIKWKVQ